MSVNVFGKPGVRDLLDNLRQKTQVGDGSIGAGIIRFKSTFLERRSNDCCLATALPTITIVIVGKGVGIVA